MVALHGSATRETGHQGGRNVWAILRRAALRGIDWAAATCGVGAADGGVEGYESLLAHDAQRDWPGCVLPARVDWAKLDDFGRGRIARVLSREQA